MVLVPADSIRLLDLDLEAEDGVEVGVRRYPVDLDVLVDIGQGGRDHRGRGLRTEDVGHRRVVREPVDVLDTVSEAVECRWRQACLGVDAIGVDHGLADQLVEGSARSCVPLEVVRDDGGTSALLEGEDGNLEGDGTGGAERFVAGDGERGNARLGLDNHAHLVLVAVGAPAELVAGGHLHADQVLLEEVEGGGPEDAHGDQALVVREDEGVLAAAVGQLRVELVVPAAEEDAVLEELVVAAEEGLHPLDEHVVALEGGGGLGRLGGHRDGLDDADGRPVAPAEDVARHVPELVLLVRDEARLDEGEGQGVRREALQLQPADPAGLVVELDIVGGDGRTAGLGARQRSHDHLDLVNSCLTASVWCENGVMWNHFDIGSNTVLH